MVMILKVHLNRCQRVGEEVRKTCFCSCDMRGKYNAKGGGADDNAHPYKNDKAGRAGKCQNSTLPICVNFYYI